MGSHTPLSSAPQVVIFMGSQAVPFTPLQALLILPTTLQYAQQPSSQVA